MTEQKPKQAEPSAPASPALTPAAESGDPDVHRLLAERQAHLQNIQPEDPDLAARREVAKKAIEDIDKHLAELGYTAS